MEESLPFRIGETVCIIDNRSPYYSQEGLISAHLVSKHAHLPDKYDVIFADGRSATFSGGQLKMTKGLANYASTIRTDRFMPCIPPERLSAVAKAEDLLLTAEEFDHLDGCRDCLEQWSACIAESGRRMLEESYDGGSGET
jgi:hypothetical protein